MKIRQNSLLLFFLFIPVFLSAQIDTLRFNKFYLKKYWDDTKGIVVSPAQWDGKDWTKFALFAGTTLSVMAADREIQHAFQNFNDYAGETGEKISANFLEPWGASYSLITTGTFLTVGLLAKEGRSRSTGLLAAESFILASAFVRVPKYLFGRARPDSGADVSQWDFQGPGHGNSFPSGHTIAVFSVASVIANQYADTKWVPVVAYSVAGLTGLSRIYDNRHWASDVFVSAVWGTLIGNYVCHRDRDSRISVVPFQTNSLKGIKLALTL